MTAGTNGSPDAGLIDEAVDVVHAARARAPQDFLFGLALVLGSIALALLGAAALTGGTVQDLLLNLGSEVLGAWLTVVLIDGLWKRLEAGATASLEAMTRKLDARRGMRLTDGERSAWRSFVDDYRATGKAESAID